MDEKKIREWAIDAAISYIKSNVWEEGMMKFYSDEIGTNDEMGCTAYLDGNVFCEIECTQPETHSNPAEYEANYYCDCEISVCDCDYKEILKVKLGDCITI